MESRFIATPAETSKSYEIGFKSEFFNDTLKVNVAAFRQDFKNYPYRSVSGVFFLQTDAPGAAARVASGNFVSPVPVRVNGLEAEFDWRPNDSFSVSANVAYAKGKIRNGTIACNDFVTPDGVRTWSTPRRPLPRCFGRVGANNVSTCNVKIRSMTAAPWNGNVQAEYKVPVNDYRRRSSAASPRCSASRRPMRPTRSTTAAATACSTSTSACAR